ncbi:MULTISPECIES: mechanosensitive ion channel family protein [Streptomyces]|uniref:mechanosensitive ion channel family protein n=1 Tax=Streptomyces TaxID=1883 RepID=UPI000A39464F|nr:MULTISPECIES: mechanosensitive ion channel family protein [Streptomyces]RIH61908.1 mechanosensitive ion channel family protein [Streptomyces sp. SHP22-7]WDI18447.1 mechanosensitive ion channel family protein [Streptomyces enissocaesilis]MBJ6619616.1 mechanosensitive ion channel family protein [Streptomyces sp. DHE17-7]MBQ0877293.1 mechanosensitive ion channel family protein [Streptomyces sp. RT42]MBQ0911846.1 mechanosensitive ion channel family protein [Streptomyces sp. RM99]
MSLFAAVLPAAGPSPSPSPSESSTPAVPSFQDAQESASNAAGWVEENWSTWLAIGLRVLLIVVIAAVLRVVVRRAITKLIDRMNRRAGTGASTALSGLLVNAERRRQRSEAIGSVLRSVASFLILGTAALMVLGTFQINLAPLLASAGVAGVAIGFGARNLVTDFLSGVFMILEDQYGVGDSIDAGVASGEVIEVGLRVTKLRGDNGEIWYVRNGEVKRIGNLSQGWATAGVDVTVRSDEDLDQVKETIGAVGERMSKEEPWNEMLWGPIEVLGLDSVLLDSMVVRVSAKTMPGKSLTVERELRWRVKRAFDAAGIRIVGGPEVPAQEAAAPDPTAGMAAPSAYSSTVSPQSMAASPIPPPTNINK